MSPVAHSDSLASSPFNTGRRAPTIHQDEPFTVLHTDGLLPTKLISLTSPSLYFKQTGSLIQFSLTSSPFNTGRRAPTIHQDEPFTVLHTDGLLPTKLISLTSPSLYFKQTGSLIQFSLTSSPFNTGRRAPTIHQDEPFTVLHTAGLLPTKLISLTSSSLYFKQTGSLIQFSLTSSPFNTGRRAPTVYERSLTPTHWRALPLTQADELLLFIRTSPSLYFTQPGSSPQNSSH